MFNLSRQVTMWGNFVKFCVEEKPWRNFGEKTLFLALLGMICKIAQSANKNLISYCENPNKFSVLATLHRG
jgi:hypothetical protein